MFISEARINANRRNALLSKGPVTQAGKEKSRVNSLKHGVCAAVLAQENVEDLKARTDALHFALRPQNEFQAKMVDHAAVAMLRLEHCERVERRVRTRVVLKAELGWDDERRLESEEIGAMLPLQPGQVVEALRRSPHGCDWLMARWAMLARAADVNSKWDDEQTAMAYDLLATPDAFRKLGRPGTALDFDGKVVDDASDSAAVARRAIAELREQREIVAELDEVERAKVESDYDHDNEPELRRLRRYETTLHNRLKWLVNQVSAAAIERPQMYNLRPRFEARQPVAVAPEPPHADEIAAANHPSTSIHPPFCLEPDEFPKPGETADIPAILKKRRRQRLEKTQTRRESWKRKIDQPLN
jgi:hypothetical protein